MFKILLTARAKKEFKQISKSHQIVIRQILEEIKDDYDLGKPLTRELTGRFSYRAGFYRIIYKVNKKDKIIHILTAGYRSIVYN